MKKALALCVTLLLLGTVSSYAAVGWAGQIWPNSGNTYLPTDNIGVYVQVWKDGCTGPSTGPCADLTGWLYYKKATDALYDSVAMTFNVFVGNNDELTATIPALSTQGGVDENFYVRIYDASDGTWYDGAQDQNGNSPPFTLHIQEGTSRDVAVTFRVDMNCVNPLWFSSGVFFTGDFLGPWTTCHPSGAMTDGDLDGIWEGTFVFYGGSNPYHEYKFQRNDGTNCFWDAGPNSNFLIDDSNPTQVLNIYLWHCQSWGPSEITGPGSYCVYLCCCDNTLWIPLNTPYDRPEVFGLELTPGCNPDNTNCSDPNCAPGQGAGNWNVVLGDDNNWYFTLCLIDVPGGPPAYQGCFCLTIDQILPVELVSFDATAGNEAVTLRWETASEVDNDYFEITRNGAFATRVNGQGNGAGGHRYSWTDVGLVNGTTYTYGLVSVDLNGARQELGTIEATPTEGAEIANEYALGQNYPNPFNP
ncbi:hypothetical protein KKH27_03805, partial [bacterium]|nr:hypothetical protein [bacterium]